MYHMFYVTFKIKKLLHIKKFIKSNLSTKCGRIYLYFIKVLDQINILYINCKNKEKESVCLLLIIYLNIKF